MSVLALATATTLLLGANFVEVRSATDCPSAEEVTARLRPMLPSDCLPGPDGDVAFVELVSARADGVAELRLHLLRPDGSLAGDRRLMLAGGCSDKADAVATVIAAWETEFLPVIPPRPTAAPPPPPAPARPTLSTPRVEPEPARLEAWFGASLGAAMVGGVAATPGLEAVGGSRSSRWQLRLAASTQTARRRSLDQGEVSWKHTIVAAGLVLRSRGPTWRVSVDAGPTLGWATLGGHGYTEDRTDSAFEYGGGAGLRVARTFGRFAAWLEWRTNLWAESQHAVLTGSTQQERLSSFDVTASLGVSVGHFR